MTPPPRPLAGLDDDARAVLVRSMPEDQLRLWAASFPDWAHPGQLAPEGEAWSTWVIMGGRGFGKTRAGAEWVLEQVRRSAPAPAPSDVGERVGGGADAGRVARTGSTLRVALVGATVDEARSVMVDGPSGLLALARGGEVERWAPSERRLVFANGAECALFSGRSPQSLRGPEHDIAWCNELGKWRHAGATWDTLRLGLRRGARPRALVTTTPSAEPALRRILADPGTVRTGGATHSNRHLPESFVRAVEAAYGGTRMGAQEIEGVLAVDREGSLWPAALVEACRGPAAGARDGIGGGFERIVVGVDPPATAAGTCGIVAAGLDGAGRAWVLQDASVEGRSPEGWARAVAEAARDWGADRVVAEANQGGDMVRSVLKGADRVLPLELVRASRGKWARAEPVAALFESGAAGFAGRFPALEEELGHFTAGGWAGEGSPDRADAMVWAIWALRLRGRGAPAVRSL